MSNPLIGIAARQANSQTPGFHMLIQKFKEFKKMWTPQSARQKINDMLQNGQINGQQLEQAKQMAEQMHGLFK